MWSKLIGKNNRPAESGTVIENKITKASPVPLWLEFFCDLHKTSQNTAVFCV